MVFLNEFISVEYMYRFCIMQLARVLVIMDKKRQGTSSEILHNNKKESR
jgi:hypothetical protein